MNTRNLFIALALLLVGLVGGAGLMAVLKPEADRVASSDEPRVLYWAAPMDPTFRSDSPGKSPMGMDLVPVYESDDTASDDGAIRISPAVENNIGVRTDVVIRGGFHRTLSTVGYVRPVDGLTSMVDVRAEGWIENLPVSAIGDRVTRGQVVLELYSPAIATAQAEYLQAAQIGREALLQAARSRLVSLGMEPDQIAQLGRRGSAGRTVAIRAPQDGTVIAISIRNGAFVRPGGQLMTVSDLGTVWVMADVFEDDAQRVRAGDQARLETRSLPGREWVGEVEYVYPTVNPQSRSVPVRIRLDNADGALRPDMYLNVAIQTEPRTDVLQIPLEAVIRTGQSERVILAEGDGHFRPASIVTGAESGGMVEILSGLAAGERIVVSSQFLLDSEASIQGAMLRMSPPGVIIHEPVPPGDVMPMSIVSRGTVISLMRDHGMIEIEHGAIVELGRPAGTTMFNAMPGVDLSSIEPGMNVAFELMDAGEANWQVGSIAAETAPEGDQP
ncbi:efflux RND transporter periplasmic adaptor subunit [uncultured Maricaulis sp.]|uniref:efflux RND transporter periplasmic adaptor subunit n=1 Tax=uncultured Maricaulis sp. TaxID=174710 RepID=UPI0030DBBA9C|tara:strand:- start:70418 stop:71920 length:1503 start_codon:yes stop_codon:yes gene_type:complete